MNDFTISAMRVGDIFWAWNSFNGLEFSGKNANVSDAITENEYVLKGHLEAQRKFEDVGLDPLDPERTYIDPETFITLVSGGLTNGLIDDCFMRADREITDTFNAKADVSYIKVAFTVYGEDEHWPMLVETDKHKPYPI